MPMSMVSLFPDDRHPTHVRSSLFRIKLSIELRFEQKELKLLNYPPVTVTEGVMCRRAKYAMDQAKYAEISTYFALYP
jgi:hypothetical protein